MAFTMGALQYELFKKLTPVQRNLCIAILSGRTLAEAYREVRPGTNHTAGGITQRAKKMLNHPRVVAFMNSVQEMTVSNAIMTREEALTKLTRIARTNLTDLVTFGRKKVGEDDTGNPIYQTVWDFRAMDEMNPEDLASIAELTAGKDGLKIKQHDVLTAIRRMAEIQGWLAAKKVDHTSSDGTMSPRFDVSGLSDSALKELLTVTDRQRVASDEDD